MLNVIIFLFFLITLINVDVFFWWLVKVDGSFLWIKEKIETIEFCINLYLKGTTAFVYLIRDNIFKGISFGHCIAFLRG